MNVIFFSVIIPVYNTEQYLKRCFDSFLAQSFDNKKIEMVVVNDGSPNVAQCDEIISAYKKKLNISYLKLENNLGTHIARTRGVENATGKYLLFIDPDDYLVKEALEILYNNIQTNGDADYIWFFFNVLHENGKKEISDSIKDIQNEHVLEDMLTFKVSHSVANKCFNVSFAKKVWNKMTYFYAYYNEDYYQMAILHYMAKKKRVIKKPLYVYVQGVGITGVEKYTEEKLKRTILSIYNVDMYLCSFYEDENCYSYIPLIRRYSNRLYIDCIFRSILKDFISVATEILGEECVNILIVRYILKLCEQISFYKKREKYFFLIILCCSFICKAPKNDKEKYNIEKIINISTGTFKDNVTENDIFECVSCLEAEILFYQVRARFYAPIKFILRPFKLVYEYMFRRNV